MKPATPLALPLWVHKKRHVLDKDGEYVCDAEPQMADYIVHACNAYPRAIELLSHCFNHAGIGNPLKASIQAFLRELGE